MRSHRNLKIVFAEDEGVQQLRPVAEEFMQTIFGLEPGSYLITDESRLVDFRFKDLSAEQVIAKVMDTYHLGFVPNNLLQLLRELQHRTQQ